MWAYADASPTRLCVVLEDGRRFFKDAVESHTNNEAEYFAVLTAIKCPGVVEVRTDSQLVVNQLNGTWKIKKPELRTLAELVWDAAGVPHEDGRRLVGSSGKVEFVWVLRTESLAGLALDRGDQV